MPSAGGDLSRHGLYFTLERCSYHHPSSRVSPVPGACTGVALREGSHRPLLRAEAVRVRQASSLLTRKRLPPRIRTIVEISTTVESALMVGETPNRIIEYIFNGSVLDPTPATKNVMTKSSKESVNARRAPAMTPGRMSGSVIRKNVWTGVAPKSWAASSMDWSIPESRARTTMVTNEIVNAT